MNSVNAIWAQKNLPLNFCRDITHFSYRVKDYDKLHNVGCEPFYYTAWEVFECDMDFSEYSKFDSLILPYQNGCLAVNFRDFWFYLRGICTEFNNGYFSFIGHRITQETWKETVSVSLQ